MTIATQVVGPPIAVFAYESMLARLEMTPVREGGQVALLVGGDWSTYLERLRASQTEVSTVRMVLLVTTVPKGGFREATGAGIEAFVSDLDEPEALRLGILSAAKGEPYCSPKLQSVLIRSAEPDQGLLADLSDREREMVLLADSGMSNKEIGKHLHVAETTVKSTLQRAYGKLGVHTRDGLRRKLHGAR